jgi:hypothetical protein
VATFYTDSDLTGAGEFVEPEVWLATEFTVPDGNATFRWRWPAVAPAVTPTIRVYDAGGTLVAGPISFDSTTLSAWNTAGAGSPVSLSAGTYRVVVNTTRYPALGGFFSGGSITRGSITGVQSRFGSPGSAPSSVSTATYYVDIDFSTGATSATAALSVTVSLAAAAVRATDASAGLAVTASLSAGAATPNAGAASVRPAGAALAVTASMAAGPALLRTSGAALAVIATLVSAATSAGRITYRPNTGITVRPNTGITLRP